MWWQEVLVAASSHHCPATKANAHLSTSGSSGQFHAAAVLLECKVHYGEAPAGDCNSGSWLKAWNPIYMPPVGYQQRQSSSLAQQGWSKRKTVGTVVF